MKRTERTPDEPDPKRPKDDPETMIAPARASPANPYVAALVPIFTLRPSFRSPKRPGQTLSTNVFERGEARKLERGDM